MKPAHQVVEFWRESRHAFSPVLEAPDFTPHVTDESKGAAVDISCCHISELFKTHRTGAIRNETLSGRAKVSCDVVRFAHPGGGVLLRIASLTPRMV